MLKILTLKIIVYAKVVKNLYNPLSIIPSFDFRRWGLILATLIISLLAVALFVYIRRLEKKKT